MISDQERIAVIGLGYVGLPLSVALARIFPTVGIDIDAARVAELRDGYDRTGEIESYKLSSSKLALSAEIGDARDASVIIITVPTPVDDENRPDLRPILGATRSVASVLKPGGGTIIVYESTVYPGLTEELCGPELERLTGLKRGQDFFLGYSPERINPGDREHSVDRIIKVVAGENDAVTDRLAALYGAVTTGGTFRAASIKVAEAAKVIENAQRDINIAFINEITQIFTRLGISVWDVLEAARTKWNFLPFQPGLVGGHCIGVDPYYLSHRAQQLGHDPHMILAGRAINDGMSEWLVEEMQRLNGGKAGTALVLGLTFKEDVPDLRNSKVADLITALARRGYEVSAHDPRANAEEAAREYGIVLAPDALEGRYDLVVSAVAHAEYRSLPHEQVTGLVAEGGMLVDLKAIWRGAALDERVRYWTL